jgi:hypothetical protein
MNIPLRTILKNAGTKMTFPVVILYIFFGILTVSLPSCKTKEGCGLEEKYNNVDLESSKRGKSNLFSGKQQKRMKKNK